MFLLVTDISRNRWRQRMADAECSVAGLPIETGKPPFGMHLGRRIGFYQPRYVRRRHCRRQRAEQVHVVGSRVRSPERTANLAHDSAQVGEQIVMKRGGDKRLTVLGAKDNVREEVRVGVGHALSPLRGLGGFYSNSSPTAWKV